MHSLTSYMALGDILQENTKLPTKKLKTNKTKNLHWDEWRQDFVFIPVLIYQYTLAIKNGWSKGRTPKTRVLYGLTDFLGRPPENDELAKATRLKRMTLSPTHFALSLFAMFKQVPFESLEKYYFGNKGWQNARERLRKALKLGENERYSTKYSAYERYSRSVIPAKHWWLRVGIEQFYVLRDIP